MSLGTGLLLGRPAHRAAFALWVFALVPGALLPGTAEAEGDSEKKPPFYEAERESKAEKKKTGFSGSITSSSFFFTESADNDGRDPALENASPTDRVFTDLRLQLAADHISGGNVDVKFDFRGRTQLERCEPRLVGADMTLTDCEAAQSGTFGGTELQLREAYAKYRGQEYDVVVGRQVFPDVASIRFDGVKIEQHKGENWKYSAFAGGYPQRGSRDVRADYSKVPSDVFDPDSTKERLVPVTAGVAGNYRRERIYGAIGLAGILPRGDEAPTGIVDPAAVGVAETERIFVTSNGYWQQSQKTDIYHFLVVDVAGPRGAVVTNASLGASHRPTSATRLFARLNRTDTETLNVHAQQRLDLVDPMASSLVQNNWYIARVAQQSGEVGGTATFSQNRFALSASGTLRQRPELSIIQTDQTELLLAEGQALDIQLQFVDRKSFKGFRVGAQVTRSSGVGDVNLDRSKSTMGTLELSRDLAKGKGEFEVTLSYLKSTDTSEAFNCAPAGLADFRQCYGTSDSTSMGAGGVLFYRPRRNWFVMGMANIARQELTTGGIDGLLAPQAPVRMLTAFARLAYRF